MKDKPTKAFLAGLTKAKPKPVDRPLRTIPVTHGVDYTFKFMKLIGETEDLKRLEMLRKWIKSTTNLNEVVRKSLTSIVTNKIAVLDFEQQIK